MAIYRNERIPHHGFITKLKKVDVNLYVVYDSSSMRWDIYYKNPNDEAVFLVHRVCERDNEGRDIGYMDIDDRTITKMLKMDLKRRNISPEAYTDHVRQAEDKREEKAQEEWDENEEYIYKHEKRTIDRAYDALRGLHRRF